MLLDCISRYLELERDSASTDLVSFTKLLCFLCGDVEESLLQSEGSGITAPAIYIPETPSNDPRGPFPFLHRGLGWSRFIEAIAELPFVLISMAGPEQKIPRKFSLRPLFRSWLKSRIRTDPKEEAYFIIATILILHRCAPSPLAEFQPCDFVGDCDFWVKTKRTHIKYALKNLIELCESCLETDFLMLHPEPRLNCLLFYINWHGDAAQNGQPLNMVGTLGGQTQLISRTLAQPYLRDPLILAVTYAQAFLDAGHRDEMLYQYRSFQKWCDFAKGFIKSLRFLNTQPTFAQPEPLIIDTLVALVLSISNLTHSDIPTRYHSLRDPRVANRYALDIINRAPIIKRRIISEAYRFCVHLSVLNKHARFRTILLVHRFIACCNQSTTLAADERLAGEDMKEKHLLDAIELLPCSMATTHLQSLLDSLRVSRDWSTYALTLSVIFRLRPNMIYNTPDYVAWNVPTICIAPHDYVAMEMLTSVGVIGEVVNFPIKDAEPIAAHHFLTMGRFPLHYPPNHHETEATAPQLQNILKTAPWSLIAHPFMLLAKIYFTARDFFPAAIFANAYITIARLNWTFRNCDNPLEMATLRKFLVHCYKGFRPDIMRVIQILTISLQFLGLLDPKLDSAVAWHTEILRFKECLSDPIELSNDMMWEVAEPDAEGGRMVKLWAPTEELPYEDKLDFDGYHYYLQLRGWFYLIDKDVVWRDARRRLVTMTVEREGMVERILAAEARMELPVEEVTSRDAASDHLFLRILSHLEYPDEYYSAVKNLLAEYGLRVGPYREEMMY